MKLHANNALIPVVVLLLGGLAFALAVNHFTQEQTALRITQIERARAEEEAARHSGQQAHVRALQARVIAAQQAARVAALPGDPIEGQAIYASCAHCHGRRGEGKEEFLAPQLTRLAPWYLKHQLVKFREGVRGGHEWEIEGRQMIAAMRSVGESAFADLIAYIQSRR